ncbi:MAG: rhodanese-like domain-containing protein [Acutalibacteraceae bacterium]
MDQKYINVSFKEAKKIIDTQDCIILDVRTDEEFYTGHAEGAVNFDVDTINSETAAEQIPNKATPILVYCKTGERAKLAAEALSELGYKKIYNIGSLVEWPYGLSYD